MKLLIKSFIRFIFLSFSFLAIIFGSVHLFAAEPDRVAIIPFKMNAQKDHTFLQNGIYDMLSSRLAGADKVRIIGRVETEKALGELTGPVNEISAKETGEKLNADFVLFGSLTIFGNSVSIDVKMADVSGSKPTLAFFDHTQSMDEVIGRINMIASDINEKVFGIKTAVAAPRPESSAPAPESQKKNIHAHPETLLKGSPTKKDTRGVDSSPFIMQQRRGETPKFRKSRNFKMRIRGLALGDVDGDDKIETVTISNQKVLILRSEDGHFTKIKEISGRRNQKFISVDVADIKKDGRDEIFVTCVNTIAGSLDSFVLEFDGNDFQTIAKGENWYFRVHQTPKNNPVLLGQKRGISDLFLPGVYPLTWSNGSYESKDTVSLPKGITIFGFATGDVMNDGNDGFVTFGEDDRIRIFSPDGEIIWKSEDRFGGSKNFLLKTPDSDKHIFLPQRILITDLNRDGNYEVTVVKNHSTTG
ncbi:MAG: VCBS repeat-containing protein, partial [Deltaproteobacteria bacterium]|nr:VCBS repeat-containing protein [Deltaproteobacteria bacterium]